MSAHTSKLLCGCRCNFRAWTQDQGHPTQVIPTSGQCYITIHADLKLEPDAVLQSLFDQSGWVKIEERQLKAAESALATTKGKGKGGESNTDKPASVMRYAYIYSLRVSAVILFATLHFYWKSHHRGCAI